MASNIISVSATGLNEILASLIAMQNAMKGVTQAAKVMQNQINLGANPSGGNSNGAGGNGGAAERVRREANTSSQALRDNARRESMAFVAAYAEIASSVFALTAAFNALKSVAQFDVMLRAQDNFARSTGINLKIIAKTLQETTSYAIDFQQASQFSSIGRLAGFSTKQIVELAQAGRAAATILGRDVPEAMSRMFRGVSKGEPELLDELGIFIRLDRAYKDYVATVATGQKILELTAWQRTQATQRAAVKAAKQITEGNANAKIDDFTTSAAIITTTLKTAMISVTNIIGPVVKFLTQNTELLVAAMLMLGGKVIGNLGNILVNVTKAKTAQTAVRAQITEAKSQFRANADRLATESKIQTLAEKRNKAQSIANDKQKEVVKEWRAAATAETNRMKAAGLLSAAEAKARNEEIKKATKEAALAKANAAGSAAAGFGSKPNSAGYGLLGAGSTIQAKLNNSTAALASRMEKYTAAQAATTSAQNKAVTAWKAAATEVAKQQKNAGTITQAAYENQKKAIAASTNNAQTLARAQALAFSGVLGPTSSLQNTLRAAVTGIATATARQTALATGVSAANAKVIQDWRKVATEQVKNDLKKGVISASDATAARKEITNAPANAATLARAQAAAGSGLGANGAVTPAQLRLQASLIQLNTLRTQENGAASRVTGALAGRAAQQAATGWARVTPAIGAATAALRVFGLQVLAVGAAIKVGLTAVLSTLGAIVGAFSIILIAGAGLKALGDYMGLFGKGIGELNDHLKETEINLKNTFIQFSEIGKLDKDAKLDKAIIDAKKYTNILDTTSAALQQTIEKINAVKPGLFRSADNEKVLSFMTSVNSLLDERADKIQLAAVRAAELKFIEDKYTAQMAAVPKEAKATAYGVSTQSEQRAAMLKNLKLEQDAIIKNTSSMKAYQSSIDTFQTPSVAAGIMSLTPVMKSLTTASQEWSGTLSGVENTIYNMRKNFSSLVGVLRAESTFNAMAESASTLHVEVKRIQTVFKNLVAEKGSDLGGPSGAATIQQAVKAATEVQQLLNSTGVKVDPFIDDMSKSANERLDKANSYLATAVKITKDNKAYQKAFRDADVQNTARLNMSKQAIVNITTDYARQGFAIDSVTSKLTNYMDKQNELTKLAQTKNYISKNENLDDKTTEAFIISLGDYDAKANLLISQVTASKNDLLNSITDFSASGSLLGISTKDVDNIENIEKALEAVKKNVRGLDPEKLLEVEKGLTGMLNVAKFKEDFKDSLYPEVTLDMLRKSVVDTAKEFQDPSIFAQWKNMLKEMEDKSIFPDPKQLKEMNDEYAKILPIQEKSFRLASDLATAFDFRATKSKIIADEMLASNEAALSLASELKSIFSGINLDVASKIAGMEAKLRDSAVTAGTNATDKIINSMELKSELFTADAKPLSDTKQEAYRQAKIASIANKSVESELRLGMAREEMLKSNIALAMSMIGTLNLTQKEIDDMTKAIKEAKWSTLMIEAAKQVTSAWEDAKASIANGMGKDGKSIADSLKDSLGKGTQGIQDYIGAKLGKKQAVAFDALENKAKDYFLGSKDKDGKRQDGIFKSLGDKFTSAFPKLGKVGGFLGDAGGLDALKGILSKDAGQRNAAIGGALGSIAGKSIGMAFGAIGGPLGMAVGSVLGNIVGSVFSKKLKETGVLTKVSELGVVSANSIEIFKKTGLSGTKTIESVGNSLEAEAVSALQNAVTTTRKSYESNILSLNSMTNNVFGLTTKSLNKAFSSKYLQAAGGGKSESDLLKDFIKDYGDFLGGDQVGFLSQFKDITESLTDVLARLVTTLKVTDATFKSAFGKGTGLIGNLVPSYSKAFIKDEGAAVVDRAIDKIEDIAYLVRADANKLYIDREGSGIIDSITKHIQNMYGSIYVPPATIPSGGDGGYVRSFSQGKPIPGSSTTSSASTTASQAAKLPGYFEELLGSGYLYDANDNMQKVLILVEKYINGTISAGEKAKLVTLAALDFTDRIVKTFDGENIAAKTEAYNKAMSGYANMVSSSIIVTSGQVSTLLAGMQDVSSTILPPGLQVIKNGLLVPIQEFNTEMKKAIESGVSPEKIAEGIKLGSKLSEVINGVLETFSSINLSDLKGASDLSTSVNTAIMSNFKSSAIDSFKKSLLAPLLVDLTTSIDKASIGDSSGFVSSMKNYALSGDIVTNQAKNMVQVLSDPAFKSAMDSVSIEFEKLMKIFDSANSSEIISSLSKAILDIEKTLKESAYSFAVSGDAYSVALFKAKEAFKAAGLSSELASEPISSVVSKMKAMASSGSLTTKSLDSINEALNAMADVSIAARDQIQATVDASQSSIDTANNFMISLTKSIIDDSGSIEAAKASLSSILTLSASKVDKAREEYSRAKASGNLLAANQAAENLTTSLEAYVNAEIDTNNTLKSMAEDRYNAEKAALDNVKTIISDIANFVKDLKFDDKLSILKPIDRLTEAASNFDNLRAKVMLDAANGQLTPEALKNLQDDSKRLLDLGRDVYASGTAYTDLYSKVMGAMATVDSRAQADIITKEASTKLYQDMALAYAKDNRDIQIDALSQLKMLTKASAVDNAISVDMINALKYNQGLPQSVTLSDYYKQLFSDAQGGGTIFTQPNVGYQDFKNVGTYDEANKVAQEATNAKLNLVLETLTTVLQNLPVNVKSAIQSSTTPTVNRN